MTVRWRMTGRIEVFPGLKDKDFPGQRGLSRFPLQRGLMAVLHEHGRRVPMQDVDRSIVVEQRYLWKTPALPSRLLVSILRSGSPPPGVTA